MKEAIDIFRQETQNIVSKKKKEIEEEPTSVFQPKKNNIEVKHIWEDDGKDTPENKAWRKGLGIEKGFDGGSLREVIRTPEDCV